MVQISGPKILFCRAYFSAKLKPGRFPYLEDEARQVSLYGIVPCTRMKNSLELISYPLFFLLRLKFDNDVIIKLGRAARLWNGPSLRGHKWGNGARFQNNINMARKTKPNKLADGVTGVLNR